MFLIIVAGFATSFFGSTLTTSNVRLWCLARCPVLLSISMPSPIFLLQFTQTKKFNHFSHKLQISQAIYDYLNQIINKIFKGIKWIICSDSEASQPTERGIL